MAPLVASAIPILGSLLDKLIPDREAAAKAKLALLELESKGELAELDWAMKAIIAEAQSGDPFTSRARPAFLYVIYIYILMAVPVAMVSVFAPEEVIRFTDAFRAFLGAVPEPFLWLFGAGYLGYSGARSWDKKNMWDHMEGMR